MALTYTIRKRTFTRNSKRNLVAVVIGVAGDYSSGLTITPAGCGLVRIDALNPLGATVGVTLLFDPTTLKLRAYKTAAGAGVHAEVAGADVAAQTVLVEAVEYVNA